MLVMQIRFEAEWVFSYVIVFWRLLVHFFIIYKLEHCPLSVVGLDACDTDQV